MSFASMTLNVLKILVVGFTLELQVWCKGPCNCNLLWVWRGNHGNFCSSKKPKFPTKDRLHHTWEHTWPKTDMDAICTMCMLHVQRFQDSNERRDRDWQLFLFQVIYFVNKCEAMFSTTRLKVSKCTWIKCLLETDLAFSVKPTTVLYIRLPVRHFFIIRVQNDQLTKDLI